MHRTFLFYLDVPNDLYSSDDEDDMESAKNCRISRIFLDNVERSSDKRRVPENESSDSEDEGDDRRDHQTYKERSSLMSHDKERNGTIPSDVDMDAAPVTEDEADDEADDDEEEASGK